ncbi:uncharacterized protein LOC111382814 [Olea europaea subsp. europaea]|uniref:Uncharacterized protein LOC111382814 n=1 Tax=Olea europaea subsp. europaea TaxID=158383 RepID=A0A8S0VPW8_OLEEU|nr:uncharacterized protein LOC111382814 [Olea europaea subsp. europaea]
MPERKFKPTEQIPTTALRRSPRFLQSYQPEQGNPLSRKSEPSKIWLQNSCPTPICSALQSCSSKTQKDEVSTKQKGTAILTKRLKKLSNGSRRYTRSDGRADMRNNGKDIDLGNKYVIERRVTRRFKEEVSRKQKEMDTGSKRLKKLTTGSRRYATSDGRDRKKNGEGMDLCKQYVIERRVTRSLTRENGNVSVEVTECVPTNDCSNRATVLSDEGKAEFGVNLSAQFARNAEKRVVPWPGRVTFSEHFEKGSNDSTDCLNKVKAKGSLPEQSISKFDDHEWDAIIAGGDEKEGNGCRGKTLIHENRSRSRIEEGHSIVKGWTKEQDLALQRAYFTAKPTPHFWKKVAQMVPGKSAQECFDRIQSENLTPSQPRACSRVRKKNESLLSLSASKLLNSAETKIKKFKSSKRKSLLALKTVRQLIEKQQNTDYEADLFTVLEPTTSPSTQFFQECAEFATPEQSKKGLGFLKKCQEKSSSAHKKQLSRLKSTCNAAFVSPPVLKQIKNKALHEKYIDQLHLREARRKAASTNNAKCVKSKNDKNNCHLEKGNAVKAAKDALLFDTQEAINQLRQSSKLDIDDIDYDCFLSDEDEGEDRFL